MLQGWAEARRWGGGCSGPGERPGGSERGGQWGAGDQRSDAGCVFEVKPTGFPTRLGVGLRESPGWLLRFWPEHLEERCYISPDGEGSGLGGKSRN